MSQRNGKRQKEYLPLKEEIQRQCSSFKLSRCSLAMDMFAIIGRRLTSFLTDNAYPNTSVQKGDVPGFSGCIEHASAITQLILESREEKRT